MSETRFPPPRPPGTSAPSGGSERPAIQNALVISASSSVTDASRNRTLLLDGRISALNPQRGEITVSTAKGDIVIQSGGASLPVGTDVTIELRMQGLSLRANIAVIRQKNAEAKAAQEIARPPSASPQPPEAPAIKAGDRLIALRLPTETPPPAAQSASTAEAAPKPRPTLEQAAQIIEAARASVGISRLAMMLPPLPSVPLPVVWQVLNTRDVITALLRLPETMQTQLLDFIARPDVAGALRQILPPVQAGTLLPPPPAGVEAEALAQAQMALRPVPATPTPATPSGIPASPAPLLTTGGMMGLLPFLDNLMPAGSNAASLMMGGKLPNMTPGAQNLPLPQNIAQLTVYEVLPQGTSPPAARPAGSVVAVVDALTASGAPILKTPDAHFVLRQSMPLPVGTQLIVSIQPAQAADILAEAVFPPRTALPLDPLFSRGWPALDEALALLNASAAQAAQALAQTIPAATARLASTTLFFLAALRMGSIESWLGAPAMDALRGGGRKDLAERLTQDFGRLSSLSKNIVAGEWRAISMPLMQQDQHISLIQFFLRQQPAEDNENAEGAGNARKITRFILNLHLSRMGDMQLDGLLHKKRFDLILRSEEKLPADIRQELAQRFTAGLEQTGMDGGLSFQTRAEHWMQIPESAEAGTQA